MYSNTTLVKVKCKKEWIELWQKAYSNTTLVKVKYKIKCRC